MSIFLKLPRTYIWLTIIILAVFGGYFLFRAKPAELKTFTVEKGDIRQTVSATGQISSSDKVELSFDSSGKVNNIYGSIGDQVAAGGILARLESSDLSAQLQNAKASVLSAQAKLDQLLSGVRSEDVDVLEISLENAKKTLEEARTSGSSAIAKIALNAAIDSLVAVADLHEEYRQYFDYYHSEKIYESAEKALFAIYNQPSLGKAGSWFFLQLKSGLVEEVNQYSTDPSAYDSSLLLPKLQNILLTVEDTLNLTYSALNFTSIASDADKASVTTAKSNVLAQISAITTQEQTITSAKNSIASYESQLILKKAPPTIYEVEIAKSQLLQAQANQNQIEAKIQKNILRSPIDGTIAGIDLKIGEIAVIGARAFAIIGLSKFQIEAAIPEVDVAKIRTGNPVKVTLDAFGPDVIWEATVIQIYPSEKIVEGVPTYKTIIVLSSEDERIKSGMTANLEIFNEFRENVLFLPQRAIIRQNGKKFAKILLPGNYANNQRFSGISVNIEPGNVKTAEIEIKTGLYGSDGRAEILAGLEEGDQIIIE